jgi:hypothetical protein
MKDKGYSEETYKVLSDLFSSGDSISEILTAFANVIQEESANCHRGGFEKVTVALMILAAQALTAASEAEKDVG